MLAGTGHARVERVEVHLQRVGDVARHHRALEEMDVVEPLDQPGRVVDVLEQQFAIFALLDVHHMDGGPGRPVVDPSALYEHVVAWVLTAKREVPGGIADRRQHEVARKADSAIGVVARTGARQCFDAARDRVGEAHRLKHREHQFVDAFQIALAQCLVPAAGQSCAYRADILGERRSPHRASGLAPAGAPRRALA